MEPINHPSSSDRGRGVRWWFGVMRVDVIGVMACPISRFETANSFSFPSLYHIITYLPTLLALSSHSSDTHPWLFIGSIFFDHHCISNGNAVASIVASIVAFVIPSAVVSPVAFCSLRSLLGRNVYCARVIWSLFVYRHFHGGDHCGDRRFHHGNHCGFLSELCADSHLTGITIRASCWWQRWSLPGLRMYLMQCIHYNYNIQPRGYERNCNFSSLVNHTLIPTSYNIISGIHFLQKLLMEAGHGWTACIRLTTLMRTSTDSSTPTNSISDIIASFADALDGSTFYWQLLMCPLLESLFWCAVYWGPKLIIPFPSVPPTSKDMR